MIKRLIFGLLIVAAIGITWGYFRFFTKATAFEAPYKYLYIPTQKANKATILKRVSRDSIVKKVLLFDKMAEKAGYWDNIIPGRYRIEKGMSLNEIIALLKSGRQYPVKLFIPKLRTLPELGMTIRQVIEADSASVMAAVMSPENLQKNGLTPVNWSAFILPGSYQVLWTDHPDTVLQKLIAYRNNWWEQENRKNKAAELGFSPENIHTLASIVEEETNDPEDRKLVASVYLNRLKIGMPLQADPTVRFALKDFTSNRVLYAQLRTPSAYNTYLNRGLPPGPICTPTAEAITAVLQSPKTDYLYFVANADLRGGSTFTTNYKDHIKAAKLYRDSLNAWLKRKKQAE
jgi:UPF0755 protein